MGSSQPNHPTMALLIKRCPTCQFPAELEKEICEGCGRAFETQFDRKGRAVAEAAAKAAAAAAEQQNAALLAAQQSQPAVQRPMNTPRQPAAPTPPLPVVSSHPTPIAPIVHANPTPAAPIMPRNPTPQMPIISSHPTPTAPMSAPHRPAHPTPIL